MLPGVLAFAAMVAREADQASEGGCNLGVDYWIAQGEPEEDAAGSMACLYREQRERAAGADPIHLLDVRAEVQRRLDEAAALHGAEPVQRALAAAGAGVAAELRAQSPPG